MPVHKKAYWAYMGLLLVGAVLLFLTRDGGFGDSLKILTFAVIGFLAELWTVPIPGFGRISSGFVIQYTAILILGPKGAFVQALICQPINAFFVRRLPLAQGMHNMTQFFFLSVVPNPAIHIIRALPEVSWTSYLTVLFGGAVYSLENILLMSISMSLMAGAPWGRLWSMYSFWYIPYFFLTLPFPVIYLWLYHQLGYLGLLVGYLPAYCVLAVFSHQARAWKESFRRLINEVSEGENDGETELSRSATVAD